MFITKIKMANLLTYIATLFALMSVILSIQQYEKGAFICFIFAGVCDMFDGRFASMFKRSDSEKEMGIQIDSLADVSSFLIVPVVLSLSMGLDRWYNIIIYIIYVVLGITRLAYFNVFANEKKAKGEKIDAYPGVAVTYSSLVFPLVYLLNYFVDEVIFSIIYTVTMFILSILFITNIKVKKPGVKGYIVLSILAVITIVMIIIL